MDSSFSANGRGRRQRQKHLRQRRILGAARRLFDRKGFAATAMEQVADKAGLAVGTLYNYFPSKNDLLLAILRRETQRLTEEGEAILRDPPHSPADAVNALAELFIASITADERKLWRDVLAAAMAAPDGLGARLFELDLRLAAQFGRMVDHLKSAGAIAADVDAVQAAGIFYSVCLAWGMAFVMNEQMTAAMMREQIRSAIGLAIRGMLARDTQEDLR